MSETTANLRAALTDSAMRRRIAENDFAARRLSRVSARYDAVAPTDGNRRRASEIDLQEETGAQSRQLKPYDRLALLALTRDAQRNFSATRAIMRQLRLNVVGWQHKLYLDPDLNTEAAQTWFNVTFARNCSFRDDAHISELWGLSFDSVIRDGDCGQFFDRDLAQSGRLIYYEADQICDLSASDLPKVGAALSQDGVLRDSFGREIGYCVNRVRRGATSCGLADAMIFPRDPLDDSANMFRLLRLPWRHNQGRGISELAATVNDMLDCYDMRTRELQSARLAASMGMKVKRGKKDEGELPPNFATDAVADGDALADPAAAEEEALSNYERFEHLTGGYIEYLDEGDDVESIDINRPNINGIAFVDWVVANAGSSLGMAKAYALVQAGGSYTQFRGDMVMTWVLFEFWQKWIERHMKDWTALRAIPYAVERGLIKTAPAEGWQNTMVWAHPRMPNVDVTKEQDGITKAMKNGTLDPSDIIGPDWEKKSDKIFAFFDKWRGRGYTAAAMESASGNPSTTPAAGKTEEGDAQ